MWTKLILETIVTCSIIYFAAMTVNTKHPIRTLLFLILTFATTAFLFLHLELEFLGFIFILVYVGAVLVLFLFATMTLNTKNLYTYKNSNQSVPAAGAVFGAIFFIKSSDRIFNFSFSESATARQAQTKDSIEVDYLSSVSDLYTAYCFFLKRKLTTPHCHIASGKSSKEEFDLNKINSDNIIFTLYESETENWYETAVNSGSAPDIEVLGFLLYSKHYVIPMLLIGLILLVALVGVVYLTKKIKLPRKYTPLEIFNKVPKIKTALNLKGFK